MDSTRLPREPAPVRNERLATALAELNLLYEDVASLLDVDPKTVERWVVKGRRPYRRHRARLAKLLRVPSAELWPGVDGDVASLGRLGTVVSNADDGTVDDVDRAEFLRGAAGLAAVIMAGPLPGSPAERIGRTEVESIRQAAITVKSKASRLGGEAALHDAIQLCKEADRLLNARVPVGLWAELATAVGWLAANAGAVCHDAGRELQAGRLWRAATVCANEADSSSLLARVLGHRARQAIWLGCPDEAVSALLHALDQPDLLPSERAQLSALLGRAYAGMDDAANTLRTVGQADEAWSHHQPGEADDRPWIASYDAGLHMGETSDALCALADQRGSGVADATGRCQTAISLYADTAAGSRVLSMIQLAITDMQVGDPHWAVTEGHAALDIATRVRSSRVRSEVARLGSTANRFAAQMPDAAELRDRCMANSASH